SSAQFSSSGFLQVFEQLLDRSETLLVLLEFQREAQFRAAFQAMRARVLLHVADQRRRLDASVALERHRAAARTDVDLAQAERARRLLVAGDAEQILRRFRQQADAIDDLYLQLAP